MTQYFSPAGLEKLKHELEERKLKTRSEISLKIAQAKELGDLSENAEYIEAKELQAFNEGRIEELDDLIKNAVIIQHDQQGGGLVAVGSTVSVASANGEHKFTIVGASEADPSQGFISNESPLGSAFLGRQKGDEVEVRIPSGIVKYKILGVS